MHRSKISVADRKLTEVFRMVGQVLGSYLRCSPDGEVGMSMPATERRNVPGAANKKARQRAEPFRVLRDLSAEHTGCVDDAGGRKQPNDDQS
jgi:hypothetical protein